MYYTSQQLNDDYLRTLNVVKNPRNKYLHLPALTRVCVNFHAKHQASNRKAADDYFERLMFEMSNVVAQTKQTLSA